MYGKTLLPYLYGSIGYHFEDVDAFNVAIDATPELRAEIGPSTKSDCHGQPGLRYSR